MDLVNQFVYSMVLYLLARSESFHEISALVTADWKEHGLNPLWSNLKHCPGNRLWKLMRTAKNFGQESQCRFQIFPAANSGIAS